MLLDKHGNLAEEADALRNRRQINIAFDETKGSLAEFQHRLGKEQRPAIDEPPEQLSTLVLPVILPSMKPMWFWQSEYPAYADCCVFQIFCKLYYNVSDC